MDTAVADVARSRHDIVVSFLLLAVGHPHARIRPNTSVRAFPGGESWRTHAMNSGMNLGCAMRPTCTDNKPFTSQTFNICMRSQ